MVFSRILKFKPKKKVENNSSKVILEDQPQEDPQEPTQSRRHKTPGISHYVLPRTLKRFYLRNRSKEKSVNEISRTAKMFRSKHSVSTQKQVVEEYSGERRKKFVSTFTLNLIRNREKHSVDERLTSNRKDLSTAKRQNNASFVNLRSKSQGKWHSSSNYLSQRDAQQSTTHDSLPRRRLRNLKDLQEMRKQETRKKAIHCKLARQMKGRQTSHRNTSRIAPYLFDVYKVV
uniref:Uncharacterized protein n=1 Tax=Euplotes harpa TaxID=151035 RepID=A0A7S3NH66_9SPIT|mmetsp:Transcript_6403/g.7357  ORF Transcript_6403/g.7357 Transcript_6403/m.7357 type:complete len:231 (+) Transcript_6403:607-1299(+)